MFSNQKPSGNDFFDKLFSKQCENKCTNCKHYEFWQKNNFPVCNKKRRVLLDSDLAKVNLECYEESIF